MSEDRRKGTGIVDRPKLRARFNVQVFDVDWEEDKSQRYIATDKEHVLNRVRIWLECEQNRASRQDAGEDTCTMSGTLTLEAFHVA